MDFNPTTIFDWRDRQYTARSGYLTFRLYNDGWLVRYTPFDSTQQTTKIEGADIWTACRFANDHVV